MDCDVRYYFCSLRPNAAVWHGIALCDMAMVESLARAPTKIPLQWRRTCARSRNQDSYLVHKVSNFERFLYDLILANNQRVTMVRMRESSTEPASIAALICSSRTFAVTAITGRRFCTRSSLLSGLLRRPSPCDSLCRIRRVADRPSNTGIWITKSVDLKCVLCAAQPHLGVHEHSVEGRFFQEL